jgi:hypothetical protein
MLALLLLSSRIRIEGSKLTRSKGRIMEEFLDLLDFFSDEAIA